MRVRAGELYFGEGDQGSPSEEVTFEWAPKGREGVNDMKF